MTEVFERIPCRWATAGHRLQNNDLHFEVPRIARSVARFQGSWVESFAQVLLFLASSSRAASSTADWGYTAVPKRPLDDATADVDEDMQEASKSVQRYVVFHVFSGDATNSKVHRGSKVHNMTLTSAYLVDRRRQLSLIAAEV